MCGARRPLDLAPANGMLTIRFDAGDDVLAAATQAAIAERRGAIRRFVAVGPGGGNPHMLSLSRTRRRLGR